MAEIALPLIGLGALYVFSNQKNNENFSSSNIKSNRKTLPNTNVPNENYPKQNYPIDNTSNNYVKQYINPNQTTDKLLNNNVTLGINAGDMNENTNQNMNNMNNMNQNIYSLTGNQIDIDKFKHNNMVPFFGSSVKGASLNNQTTNVLDNLQGSGSNQIKKVEQAPLFKPEDNTQYSHGMPNQSEFYLSRQLPSTKIANVLPWEQEKVAPGLGLGYTTEGSGGFNSGMLNRESWAPPTVDELRVKTNPKSTYDLNNHQGPAQSLVKNRGSLGEFEKHGPTTDFSLGPQHWLTGTGSTLAPTHTSEQMINDGNRLTTTSEYYGTSGNAGDSKVSYIRGKYQASQKPELCTTEFNPATASGHGSATATDYGIKGYNIPKNNRMMSCESKNNGIMGGIGGTFKAIVAPVMDVLRPSRKENIINNMNLSGNAQSSVPSLPLTNPNYRMPTTVKETTVDKVGLNYLNVSHIPNSNGGYQSTEVQIKNQERNNGDSSTTGFIGGTSSTNAHMDVSAWDNQHNNVNKTSINWPMAGGTSMFNSQTNMDIAKKDTNRVNDRMQTTDFIYNQQMEPSIAANIPSADSYGKINMPQQYKQEVNSERMNPEILSAFKNNPYAQSLNSY